MVHAPFPELHSRAWLKALKVFQNALDLHQSLNDWLKRICCWKNSDLCNSTEVYLSHTPPTPLFKEKKKNQKPPASQESNASLGQTTDSECEEEETKPSTSLLVKTANAEEFLPLLLQNLHPALNIHLSLQSKERKLQHKFQTLQMKEKKRSLPNIIDVGWFLPLISLLQDPSVRQFPNRPNLP